MCQTRQVVSVRITALIALAFVVSGCAALAAPGIEGAASLAGTAGSTATGYISTQSSRELNAANVELIRAQAQMQKTQAEELTIKREEIEDERAAFRLALPHDFSRREIHRVHHPAMLV